MELRRAKRKIWERDTGPTSRLGVSDCQALSTLTKDETRLSMHAKTWGASASLSAARVCAWLCTRGYMQQRQGLYKKVVAGADHGNRALWVKLAKMLYVPGVAHR